MCGFGSLFGFPSPSPFPAPDTRRLSSVHSSLEKISTRLAGRRSFAAVVALASLLLSGAAPADRVTVLFGLGADRQVTGAGAITDASSMHCGYAGASEVNCIYVFQLPTLPPGKQFTDVSIRFFHQGTDGEPSFNADLYGIRVAASPEVRATDCFVGPSDSEAVLIQDNLILASDTNGKRTSDAKELAEFLNIAYAKGAGAGQYVFFRINPDLALRGKNFSRFRIYSADYAGGRFYWPTISYKTADDAPGAVPAAGEAAK